MGYSAPFTGQLWEAGVQLGPCSAAGRVASNHLCDCREESEAFYSGRSQVHVDDMIISGMVCFEIT